GRGGKVRKAGYGQLAALLELTDRGEALLVRAARYFFRREIESDEFLARSLTYSMLGQVSAVQEAQSGLLEQLSKKQDRRFDALNDVLQKNQLKVVQLLDHAIDYLKPIKAGIDENTRLLQEIAKAVG